MCSNWSVVLHGGCARTCPELDRQTEIQANLQQIAAAAVHSTATGASAKKVVLQIVTALEDCPLFNAGNGSALTKDGVHEVRVMTFNFVFLPPRLAWLRINRQ